MFRILTQGIAKTRAKMCDFVSMLTSWTKELEPKELLIKNAMTPSVREVMASKRIAVVARLVEHMGYLDDRLVKDLVAGFKVLGLLDSCPEFPELPAVPAASMDELLTAARWSQHAVKGHLRKSDDEEGIALKKTEEETGEGATMKGPFTEAEVTSRLGPLDPVP
mgnify:FL=1